MAKVPVKTVDALYNEGPRNIQEWFTELTTANELECVFILYAKSFLDATEQQHSLVASDHCQNHTKLIHLDHRSSLAPVKPKRFIARMKSSCSEYVMTASTPILTMNNEKYRATISYQLDETKIAPAECSLAPISVFIHVKSCSDSENNNMYKSDKAESEYDSVPNEIFANESDASVVPMIPAYNRKTNFCFTNRALTPKISIRGRGYKYKLRRKSQRLDKLQLQQQQKQWKNEMAEIDRKPNSGIKTITESSSKNDNDQWITKQDNQSVSIANNQRLICPISQPNPANQLSLHHTKINSNLNNYETVLFNAPTSSKVIKSISHVSRYSGNVSDDGITDTKLTEVTATFESVASSANSSVDRRQGSTELSFQNYSSKDPLDCNKTFPENSLPTYARIANTIDHVLRVCSTFHIALNDEINEKWTSNIICEAKVLIATIQCSPCFTFLSTHDITTVRRMIFNLESKEHYRERPVIASNFLIVLLRKIIHEILTIFAKIISAYLAECTNRDRLLITALEHLIYLMLFDDRTCHIIIQYGGLDSLLHFCEVPSVSNGILRLLLRSLAILCSNYRGASKLLALNKFGLIIHLLLTSTIACSAEAAGILTQLTNSDQNYVRLGNLMPRIVIRILEIVDKCKLAESLLLALAALANITMQESGTIDILYEHNAIKRFVQAYKRPKCHNVFIQEQLLTIFISLANGAYIEALIGQGAVNFLLSLMVTNNRTYITYCERIQIRATQCLRTIANHGIGLKAIHEMNGYSVISKVMQDNNAPVDVKSNLWWIMEQLEKKYQLESAV
ncbi:Protein inscuteable [Dirofilaria immitis]